MKTKKIFTNVVMIFVIAAQTGCGLLEEKLASATENQTVPSAAADILSSLSQTQQTMVAFKSAPLKKTLFLKKANANMLGCTEPPSNPCEDFGSEGRGYNLLLNNCEPSEGLSLNGELNMRYVNDSLICTDTIDTGDEVRRKFNATITGFETFNILLSSDNHQTFTGAVLPDGGEDHGLQILTKTINPNEFSFRSTGSRRVGQILQAGIKGFDISVRTFPGDDLIIDKTTNPTITSGRIEIFHNILKYRVELTPSNLIWETNCSCPSTGSLTGEAFKNGTGSSLGSMTIDFTGSSCGSAKFNFRGKEQVVTLDTCYQN